MCNLPSCVVSPFLVFWQPQFTVFIGALRALQYNSLHSALMLQAKKRCMLGFTANIS